MLASEKPCQDREGLKSAGQTISRRTLKEALKENQGLVVATELLRDKARKQNLLFQSLRQKTLLEVSGETSNLDKSEALRTGWLLFFGLQEKPAWLTHMTPSCVHTHFGMSLLLFTLLCTLLS